MKNVVVPVLEHAGYGLKTASCYPLGTCVTPVYGPVHEVTLVRVEFQEQHDCLTAQLVNLYSRKEPTYIYKYRKKDQLTKMVQNREIDI